MRTYVDGGAFDIEGNTGPSHDGGRWYFKLRVWTANVEGEHIEDGPKSESAPTR